MGMTVVACVIALAVLTAACSATPTSPSGSAGSSSAYTLAQLEGTWALSAIQAAGAARQDRPDGTTYTLTLADGRLSSRVDCNSCAGAFSISGRTVTAGPLLACTRAACPTASFEALYIAILSGDSELVVSGSTLTLTSARGILYFTRL